MSNDSFKLTPMERDQLRDRLKELIDKAIYFSSKFIDRYADIKACLNDIERIIAEDTIQDG